MANLIGKFKRSKYNLEEYNNNTLDSFNSGKDVYYDVKRIPIKIDSFKIISNNFSDLKIDSIFYKKPISKISSDKILNFLKLSNKIRFFISNRDSKNLVTCTFENENVTVFINCHQICLDPTKQSCKDSSIINIDGEIYRLVDPELTQIIEYLNYFYNSYCNILSKSVNGNVNLTEILYKRKSENLISKFLDFLKNFNYPSLDKFFISMEKINHINDEDFDDFILNSKSIEIQKIYP
jgi:hypothetical protein